MTIDSDSSPHNVWAGQLKVGDSVRLVTPDNPRLDQSAAIVQALEPWGAHVATPASAIGKFRAAWWEMAPLEDAPSQATVETVVEVPVAVVGTIMVAKTVSSPKRPVSTGLNGVHKAIKQAREEGFTGDVCDMCGSFKMKRCGNCMTCQDCSASGGCG